MIKGVVFDMDGVISETELMHHNAWHHAAGAQPPSHEEWAKSYMGRGIFEIANDLIEKYSINITPQELVKKKTEKMHGLILESELKHYPGVKELLAYLNKEKIPIAIASSSSREEINAILEKLGIKEYFKTIVSGLEVENPKPAPDVYLKAAEELGIKPSEGIAIEDSPTGIKSAKAAGLYTIAVTHTNEKENLNQADRIVSNLSEIKGIVEELE